MALAPSVKAKLGKGLILEKIADDTASPITTNLAPKPAGTEKVAAVDVFSVGGNNHGFLYGDAIPEPLGPITNFYTMGTVVNQVDGILRIFQIPKVLVDGGDVVNFIPDSVVTRLGLPCEENDDVVIRTATNELYPVVKRTQFNINIAGVLASIKAYVINHSLSYSLILGRRWLQQVRAIGDYTTHTYVIFDQNDKPHCVPVSEYEGNEIPEVSNPLYTVPNPDKAREQMDLTDMEYEALVLGREQMDALLNQVIREAHEEILEWGEEDAESSEEETSEIGEDEDEEGGVLSEEEEPVPLRTSFGKAQVILAGKGSRY